MDNVENLLKSTMEEIERVLNSKTVVGESITVGDVTIIPLVSVGFGFGAGGGSGKGVIPNGNKHGEGEGGGAGTGGGGGIKPVAMIIIDKNGVRVESIKGGAASALESVAKTVSNAVQNSKKDKSDD
ncbi:MAG: spore germination protein GerW family protein [Gammaproteobacteria bacterium]|nr:spore germination protein GerW family protein [Gammaproteobacteria bacterium]MDH5728185.1 spore germination protein GerW family protein [Gammaproteobacteria bacterium]